MFCCFFSGRLWLGKSRNSAPQCLSLAGLAQNDSHLLLIWLGQPVYLNPLTKVTIILKTTSANYCRSTVNTQQNPPFKSVHIAVCSQEMFTITELYLCFVQAHSTLEGRLESGFLKSFVAQTVLERSQESFTILTDHFPHLDYRDNLNQFGSNWMVYQNPTHPSIHRLPLIGSRVAVAVA